VSRPILAGYPASPADEAVSPDGRLRDDYSVLGPALQRLGVDGLAAGARAMAAERDARGVAVASWSDGRQTVQPDPGSGLKQVTQGCIAEPAYLPGMPVSASEIKDYLAKTFRADLSDAAVEQKVTESVLDQNYLLPAQRAALYRFFVTVPGLKVIPQVRDYAGRPGVGVSLTSNGFTAIWIFDPKTFAYLGRTDLTGRKLSSGYAVLKVSVVNEAGQRP